MQKICKSRVKCDNNAKHRKIAAFVESIIFLTIKIARMHLTKTKLLPRPPRSALTFGFAGWFCIICD